MRTKKEMMKMTGTKAKKSGGGSPQNTQDNADRIEIIKFIISCLVNSFLGTVLGRLYFSTVIVLIIIASLISISIVLNLKKGFYIAAVVSFWSVLIGLGFLNKWLFDIEFDFEHLYPSIALFIIIVLGASIYQCVALSVNNYRSRKGKKKKSLAIILGAQNQKTINITFIATNILAAIMISIYIPNLIPHIFNNFPRGYHMEEKNLEHSGRFWTVSSEGNGEFIYKHDDNWYKYEGEYSNYTPDGEGAIESFKVSIKDLDPPESVGLFNYELKRAVGKCNNAIFEKGTLIRGEWHFENHNLYEWYKGELRSYRPSYGELKFLNGDVYTGPFNDYGNFDGIGELKFSDDSEFGKGAVFTGTFSDGIMVNGTLTYGSNNHKNIDTFTGDFKDGKPYEGTVVFSPVSRRPYKWYMGQLDKNGNFKGVGTVEWNDGTKLTGFFNGDDMNAEFTVNADDSGKYSKYSECKITFANNEPVKIFLKLFEDGEKNPDRYDSYEGTVFDNDFEKFRNGKLVYADSRDDYKSYEGDFDEKNGSFKNGGTLIYKNGNEYTGGFENNMRQGHGTLTYADNNPYELKSYTGYFKDDKPHGEGELIWINGNRYKGAFEYGYFHGEGKRTFIKFGGRRGVRDSYISGEFADGVFINGKWQLLIKITGSVKQTYWWQKSDTDWDYLEEDYGESVDVSVKDGSIVDINLQDTGESTIKLNKEIKEYIQFPFLAENGQEREIYW